MANRLFSDTHLTSMIKTAKAGARVSFAFAVDEAEKGTLILDDGLEPEALFNKLKGEVKPAARAYGQMGVEQSQFTLYPVKTMKDLKKRVRAWAGEAGVSCTAVLVSEDAVEPDSAEVRKTTETVCRAILDVLDSGAIDRIRVPAVYEEGIRNLWASVKGTHLSAEEKGSTFAKAVKAFAPVLRLDDKDQAMAQWIQTYILPRLREARAKVEEAVAAGRIDAEAEQGEDISLQQARKLQKEQDRLRRISSDLQSATNLVSARISQLHDKDMARRILDKQPEEFSGSVAQLDALNGALKVANALLALGDEDLQQRLATTGAGHDRLQGVRSRAELLKAATELAEGGTAVVLNAAALLAESRGNAKLIEKLGTYGKIGGKSLAGIGAVLASVQSACVLLDERSSDQDRADAWVNVLGAGATAVEIGATVAGSTAVAGAASVGGAALAAGYAAAKLYADAYWKVRGSIMAGYTTEAFKTLDKAAARIARQLKRGQAACELLQEETSDAQITALTKALGSIHADLGAAVDGLLILSKEEPAEKRAALPGSYRIFRETFAPLQPLKGEKDPERLVANAGEVLRTIAWCFNHAPKLVMAAATNSGRDAVDELIRKEDAG